MDMIYLAHADIGGNTNAIIQREAEPLEQIGAIHSNIAGRFEIVQTLPKKADSIEQMLDYADVVGNIRLAYINSAHEISAKPKLEKSATAIGGAFGFNTAEYKGVNLHVLAYFSQGIRFVNPSRQSLNEDFFNIDKESFTYIGEASVNYQRDNFQAKLGRVKVETPYANSDDIRMAANTFEGAWVNIDYTSNLHTQLFYANRWAGYDSQDDVKLSQDKFKKLSTDDSFGMLSASLIYQYAQDSEATLWYNYIDEMSAILYGEIIGIYFINHMGFHIDYGIQYSNIQELKNSGIEGNVYGAMSILHYYNVFIGAAYNLGSVKSGKSITDGFGGGPYYTSLDEGTLGTSSSLAPGETSEAFRIGSGYEFEYSYLDGMVAELVYGEFYSKSVKIIEKDAILTYEINDNNSFSATYTTYKSKSGVNTFDRMLVKYDYKF